MIPFQKITQLTHSTKKIGPIIDKMPSGLKPGMAIQFHQFLFLLTQHNLKVNLFSKKTLVQKHFLDSCLGIRMILKSLDKIHQPIWDFGSGNGFPGLVGAIMKPEYQFFLVEKNKKKSHFLKTVISQLELKNVEVFNGQVCSLKNSSVRFAVSRAMSPLPKFLKETKNVMTEGGKIFLFKGKNWREEAGGCPVKILKLWKVTQTGSYFVETREFFIVTCLRL